MNRTEKKYTDLKITAEMLEVARIARQFDFDQAADVAGEIKKVGRLLMTGEGSSRLFPAKHAIYQAMRWGLDCQLATEAGMQALEYDLSRFAVFGASNSGKTQEVVRLFEKLGKANHQHRYGLSANAGTPLCDMSTKSFVLTCGAEEAVAATKSVLEQGLFYHALIAHMAGKTELRDRLPQLADGLEQVLEATIDASIVERIAKANTIYFAGRNTGVAEELTLKTNETTRKTSGYLEGTYAVHGIEEVMAAGDVVIWVSPFDQAVGKFEEVLVKGVGLSVIAIHSEDTPFPTIKIPNDPNFGSYYELAAGWSVLVETGIALGVDIDHPTRARKIGYELKK